jgi:hypothetical protein
MIETRPQKTVAGGGDPGRKKALQHLNRAAGITAATIRVKND